MGCREDITDIIRKFDYLLGDDKAILRRYIWPEIPDTVIEKVQYSFGRKINRNNLVAYYDTKKAYVNREGLVFTTDGIYHRNRALSTKYIAYSNIGKIQIDMDALVLYYKDTSLVIYKLIDVFKARVLKAILERIINSENKLLTEEHRKPEFQEQRKTGVIVGTIEENPQRKKLFVEQSFFSPMVHIESAKLFPLIVMGTMSSGKSTLINALLCEDILPSQNEACTAKIFTIIDDDNSDKTELYISKKGEIRKTDSGLVDELEKANSDLDVEHILLIGQIRGVTNSTRNLMVIDTPGPNNSEDKNHEKIMKSVFSKIYGGIILVILDGTHYGTDEDRKILSYLRNDGKINKEDYKITFIVNKVDRFNYIKEPIDELIQRVRKYIAAEGFENNDVIPVSAYGANVLRKGLMHQDLSLYERREFQRMYELFLPKGFDLTAYAVTDDFPNQFDEICIGKQTFIRSSIMGAINNTGISYLEKYLQNQQLTIDKDSQFEVYVSEKETR